MIRTILRILVLRLWNNPLELILVFVMPVIFFSIFAAIFSNGIATGTDQKLRVGWIAAHSSPLADELRTFMEGNTALRCTAIDAGASTASENSSQAEQDLDARVREAQRSGRYDLLVKLTEAFPDDLESKPADTEVPVSLVTDGQNPMAVAMVSSVIRGFFAQKSALIAAERLARIRAAAFAPAASSNLPAGSPINAPFPSAARGSVTTESGRPAAPGSQPGQAADSSNVFSKASGEWRSADGLPRARDRGTAASGVREGMPAQPGAVPLPASTAATVTVEPLLDRLDLKVENPQAASQENPRIAMYAAGIAVLFLLFSATGNAAALLEEEESGTLDRILVSRAGLFHVVAGKWLGILLLGCLQITVMFLWAEAVFRIQLGSHLPGFFIMTFCTAAATASFAMVLATLCRSRAQLNAVSVVVILSMSAVGGSMIPRFAMSDRMKEIGRWTFNAWALDGYQKVFWYQTPLESLQREVTVLLGSAVVLGLLTLAFSGRWKRGY